MKDNYYFNRFLKVAPLSLAVWRGIEAYQMSRLKIDYKKPILDIGCGFGEFAGIFFASKVEVGVDIEKNEILRARQVKKYHKLVLADARKLPFKAKTFNTIISNSVLEHIPKVEEVINECYRVLNKGGYFIYTVPTNKLYNNLFYTTLLENLGLKPLAHIYFRLINKVFKHVNITRKEEWLSKTKKAGFKVVYTKEMISRQATRIFDLTILPALPSQITRWLFGKRFVVNIPGRIWLCNKLFGHYITEEVKSGSNLIVVAQKT